MNKNCLFICPECKVGGYWFTSDPHRVHGLCGDCSRYCHRIPRDNVDGAGYGINGVPQNCNSYPHLNRVSHITTHFYDSKESLLNDLEGYYENLH